MWLIFLLIISSFYFSKEDKNCEIIGETTIKSGYSANFDFCVFIDTIDFNSFKEVIIEIFVRGGTFREDKMYYGETSEKPAINSHFLVSNTQPYSYIGSHKVSPSYFSYNYKMPKITERYLIVSSLSYIGLICGISISVGLSSLAKGLIAAGVILCIIIIVIIIIIIVCFIKRKKKRKLLSASVDENSPSDKVYSSHIDYSSFSGNHYIKPSKDYPSTVNDYPPPPTTDYSINGYTQQDSIHSTPSINDK